ncbi:DUF3306 domain-containing protein [Sulfitobacter sp. JB4-11]|uniref:DUF3306 domain-containing protein n=1 Tax=Sulfitobacter rhodophyticola TaxID=3238304 RepID=UPI003D814798
MSRGSDFWARRRAGVAAEAEAEQAALDARALQAEHAAYQEMSEAEVLEALDLPDPDTLTHGDDFTVFMAKAVPDQIRRRALRTLWRSNPVLANVDMLVDYGEDFTDSAMVVENLQTAYQVGKGMLKHIEEMARQAEEAAHPKGDAEEIDDQPAEDDVLIAAVGDDVVKPSETAETADHIAPAPAEAEAEETLAAPAPRRMKFRIEETA